MKIYKYPTREELKELLKRPVRDEAEMQEAEQLVSNDLKQALVLAHQNIEKFHASQKFQA